MEMIVMASIKSLLIGMGVGGVIGGISALLTSPTSGRDLRHTIHNNKENLLTTINNLREEGLNVKDQVIKASDTGKRFITTFSDEIKEPFETWSAETAQSRLKIEEELRQIDQSIQRLEKTFNPK
jgi:gas vesicle protein